MLDSISIHSLLKNGEPGKARMTFWHLDECFQLLKELDSGSTLNVKVLPKYALEQELKSIHQKLDPSKNGLFRTTREPGSSEKITAVNIESLLADTLKACEDLQKSSLANLTSSDPELDHALNTATLKDLQTLWNDLKSRPPTDPIKKPASLLETPLIICYDQGQPGSRRLIKNPNLKAQADACLAMYKAKGSIGNLEASYNAIAMGDPRVAEIDIPHDDYVEQFNLKYSNYIQDQLHPDWEREALKQLAAIDA